MVSLDHLAVYLGLSWLAIGVVYLAVLTGGFRRRWAFRKQAEPCGLAHR